MAPDRDGLLMKGDGLLTKGPFVFVKGPFVFLTGPFFFLKGPFTVEFSREFKHKRTVFDIAVVPVAPVAPCD